MAATLSPSFPNLGSPRAPQSVSSPNAPYRPDHHGTRSCVSVVRHHFARTGQSPNRRNRPARIARNRPPIIQREEKRGIPSQRIFLAGFSQGGAVAYLSALTHPEPLAGVIALSTYIPEAKLITEDLSAANRATFHSS